MIPVHTTTLTVLRPQGPGGAGVDPQLASYGISGTAAVTLVTVLTHLRAHIGSPGGVERIVNGEQTYITYRCTADPADIQSRDRVVSSRDGLTYEVATSVLRNDIPGMEHLQMTLTRNEGGTVSADIEVSSVDVYDDAARRVMAESEVPEYMDRLAHKIHDRASEMAPKRTGELAASGAVERSGDVWSVIFRSGHALYVEMGHRIVDRRGHTHGFQAPQPYLRPALDSVVTDERA